MRNTDTFYFNSTSSISSNRAAVLYTLIMRDESFNRGLPVAYMLAKDHGTVTNTLPPFLFLVSILKSSVLFVIK